MKEIIESYIKDNVNLPKEDIENLTILLLKLFTLEENKREEIVKKLVK